jgi:hypothetical protein
MPMISNGAIQTLKLITTAIGFVPQIHHGEFISHKIVLGLKEPSLEEK